MPVVARGLGCQQDRPSPLHTTADGGNEPSCSSSTKTTNHYTVALKICFPLFYSHFLFLHLGSQSSDWVEQAQW